MPTASRQQQQQPGLFYEMIVITDDTSAALLGAAPCTLVICCSAWCPTCTASILFWSRTAELKCSWGEFSCGSGQHCSATEDIPCVRHRQQLPGSRECWSMHVLEGCQVVLCWLLMICPDVPCRVPLPAASPQRWCHQCHQVQWHCVWLHKHEHEACCLPLQYPSVPASAHRCW
jgi:hypothetical protein